LKVHEGGKKMIRLIAVVFTLAVATSAQAMSLAPLHQPDGMITQVREACGAGMHNDTRIANNRMAEPAWYSR
jgi:hypothetical protein